MFPTNIKTKSVMWELTANSAVIYEILQRILFWYTGGLKMKLFAVPSKRDIISYTINMSFYGAILWFLFIFLCLSLSWFKFITYLFFVVFRLDAKIRFAAI